MAIMTLHSKKINKQSKYYQNMKLIPRHLQKINMYVRENKTCTNEKTAGSVL